MENPSSFVQERMHDILSSFIPPPVFSVLAGFSNLVYHLLGTANDPSSWSSTLLPPLATLIAGYVALLIAYRTIQNTIRLVWWGIKWGAIIGAVIAIWAWWTGQADAINSTGSDTASDIGGLLHQAGKLPMLQSMLSLPALAAVYQQATGANPYSSRPSRSTRGSRQRRASSEESGLFEDPLQGLTALQSNLEPLLRSVGLGDRGGLRAEAERIRHDPVGYLSRLVAQAGDGNERATGRGTPDHAESGYDGAAHNTRSRTRARRGGRASTNPLEDDVYGTPRGAVGDADDVGMMAQFARRAGEAALNALLGPPADTQQADRDRTRRQRSTD